MASIWDLFGSDILSIITTILSLIVALIAKKIKNIYETKINDDVKKSVVKTVVKAVEQLYKDLSGEEKLKKAKINIINMLNEKGISISELEMDMMIEEICNSLKMENNIWIKGLE